MCYNKVGEILGSILNIVSFFVWRECSVTKVLKAKIIVSTQLFLFGDCLTQ